MSDFLLTTKTHIPPLRSHLVHRPRLIQQLNNGLAQKHRLLLISAPAGYGKSTLLGEWVSQLDGSAAWLSLEKGENSPTRFWSYFVSALNTIPSLCQLDLGRSILQAMRSRRPPPLDELLANLVNDFSLLEENVILVLDDLHTITENTIHEGLVFLIEHLPVYAYRLHLVVASRMDPPWPLARWRVRNELTEVRSKDLRFSTEEARTFLDNVMEHKLANRDITLLEQRTEGWAAGLQMATVSMQGRLKAQGPEGVSRFIEAFTGSNRFVLDYLMEEVISQQSEETRDFLYQTSILDQLTAPLCDSLVGRGDSQAVLGRLERTNLFVIPLDDERQWYRYHHLFAELLRNRLNQTWPDRISALHQSASKWYEGHNLLSEAIRHALESGDFLLVNEFVMRNAVAIIEHAELLEVLRLFEEIPDQELDSKPWLGVAYAWALMYAGRLQPAVQRLQYAEDALSVPGKPSSTDERIRGHIEAIRAYIFLQEGKVSLADKVSRRALELLPNTDFMARGFATKTLGLSLRFSSHLLEAEQVLSAAVEIYRAAGSNHLKVIALCDLGTVQYIMGNLRQAYATDLEALRLAELYSQVKGGQFPAIGYVYVYMSGLLYDINRIDESLSHARKGVESCQRWGLAEFLVDSYIALAYALSARGDWDEALEALQQARHTAMNLSEWYFIKWVEPVEVILHLRKGDLEFAARWLERWEDLADKTDQAYTPYINMIRVHCLIAQGQLDQALDIAKTGFENTIKSKAMTYSIMHLVCQAVILHLQHKDAQALEVLDQALSLAEPEGYIRVFVDQGKPIQELLLQATFQGVSPGYIEKLLSAFEPESKENISAHSRPGKLSELIEPLSARELEVLRSLDSRLTNGEIGRELYVSVNTIRTHIRNIYSKLGVNRRGQAVDKAKELKLI